MSDFGLDFLRILCQNKTMKTKKLLKKEEVMENLVCAFCEAVAVRAVDSVDFDEYYAVCEFDFARLVSEFEMIETELVLVNENFCEHCDC